jgi:hypothetical protein
MYKVEFLHGERQQVSYNLLAEHLLSQVDEEDNQYQMFKEIVDHRRDPKKAVEKLIDSTTVMVRVIRKRRQPVGNWKWSGEMVQPRGCLSKPLRKPIQPKLLSTCVETRLKLSQRSIGGFPLCYGIATALSKARRADTNLKDSSLDYACHPVLKMQSKSTLTTPSRP